ncbi:MAG: hypothetical protein PHT91_00365 [Candidatus Nanoarchaeia archaeon]|nr:hypothetical protein [Candidatus Nanoarchaeia archaeon]MDD5053938.1 hypothetical protein [Candidatus Nanoarchaeia archaeon]MDD5499313.1 hypothetical protein [Candidatus Nanoarchaeia archaeon]
MNEAQKLISSPTLNTVLMVEEILSKMDKSIFSMADIKKALPKQINHNVLKKILEYLEYSNKIAVSIKGITWIFNSDKRLKEELTKGLEL